MVEQIKIVRGSIMSITELEIEINKLIKSGWQPSGEMKIVTIDRTTIVLQQLYLESNAQC